MQPIGWDTETALIESGRLAPRMVCLTWQREGEQPQIVHAKDAEPILASWLEDPKVLLVGHNVAYDVAVAIAAYPRLLPLFFRAYEQDRITDTRIRAWLLDTAAGQLYGAPDSQGSWRAVDYTLQSLAARCAGMRLQKDAWRLCYGAFAEVSLEQWPTKARELQKKAADRLALLERQPKSKQIEKSMKELCEMIASDPSRCTDYPLEDAEATLAVWRAQEAHTKYLRDQYRQARAYFALHLSSAWGLKTDKASVEQLTRDTYAKLQELEQELQAGGLVRADGSRDTKAATRLVVDLCKRLGVHPRRTESHTEECKEEDCHIALDGDTCSWLETLSASSDDIEVVARGELIARYAEASVSKKVLTNDCELLQKGVISTIHPNYGFAETGRTTCSNPNIQNMRRLPGIRECFRPRPGYVFAQADYPQLELYTLAQCCVSWIGFSKLAEALNEGLDPHLAMAATIAGVTYVEARKRKKEGDKAISNYRQVAKVANFGLPGGLGVDKLILFARKSYGVKLDRDQAVALKKQWFETWPEMPKYFDRINRMMDEERRTCSVESLWTERHRGRTTYCAACNSGFQGLGADCAKAAAWAITREAYADPSSALFDSRIVAFIHDEFILETLDRDSAHDAAYRLSRVMADAANQYLPNVPIQPEKIEPLLMRYWSKDAKPVSDGRGRLIPWGNT